MTPELAFHLGVFCGAGCVIFAWAPQFPWSPCGMLLDEFNEWRALHGPGKCTLKTRPRDDE